MWRQNIIMNLKLYKIIKAYIKSWEATVSTDYILQASIATTTSK